MADANQLKIEARRKEAGGEYGAASRLYQRALSVMEEGNSLADPSLLVRVADLEYRQEDADAALDYYRRAVDDYAEQGLITNAIAVCNKILRVFPEQIGCYRRLADLHMDVGLVAEARQNMLRFVDLAWEQGATDSAIEAMEQLLERSPDQEIALKAATCLARLDREEDALEVLARVWRERRKADADVEALERKARTLDPDLDLQGWETGAESDVCEAGMTGAEGLVPEAPEPPPAGEPARTAAEGTAVAAAGAGAIPDRMRGPGREEGEVELVATFPERFMEMAGAPTPNGSNGSRGPSPATDRDASDASGTEAWEERAMDELDRLDGLEARSEGSADGDPSPHGPLRGPDEGAPDVPGAEPAGGPGSGPLAGGGPAVPPSGAGETSGATGGTPARPGAASPGRGAPAGEELGEEAELRRGLELLNELLEVDPDNTDLMERKVRYARRLGDDETLVSAYLDLADGMAEEGSRRGARLLYDRVLQVDAGNQRAETGLARLERGELEEKRQAGRRAGTAAADRASSPEETEAHRDLGTRLWSEVETAVREMPWLHAATQVYRGAGSEAAAPVEAFEMLGRHLMSRDRYGEAAETLERAVRLAERRGEGTADALYCLGRAHERLGEREKAADCYRRLEEVDPGFASVRAWLPEEERVGA